MLPYFCPWKCWKATQHGMQEKSLTGASTIVHTVQLVSNEARQWVQLSEHTNTECTQPPCINLRQYLWARVKSFDADLKWQKSYHLTRGTVSDWLNVWRGDELSTLSHHCCREGCAARGSEPCVRATLYEFVPVCVGVLWWSRQGQGALPDKLQPAAVIFLRIILVFFFVSVFHFKHCGRGGNAGEEDFLFPFFLAGDGQYTDASV